tara:strand:- start:219 stop:407 length:189 start_codon:yes stop_codon:yes gene_type:complete
MPYFVDPGRDVIISNLTNEADKYPPINAYEYLKWRQALSYTDESYVQNEEVNNEGVQHLPNY